MKLKVSEIFYSAQGEGRFVGVPSVFLRTFGCNFTCSGFGCAPGVRSTEADDVAKNVHLYKDFLSLPLVNTGCDSYASWHPEFKHLSPTVTTVYTATGKIGSCSDTKTISINVVNCPVAFSYVIHNTQGQCNITNSSLVDITPLEAFETRRL